MTIKHSGESYPQFVQITCTAKSNLFALDEKGGVWHYIPFRKPLKAGEKPRYAFWSKLTGFRRDPAERKETSNVEGNNA